ncbi:Transposase, ISXO2-like domain-containing protein [Strongyloides ratti]|nr:Transposase, ISXO2-like domain-containing protein [Strongyloides ratti]CEF70351.1 Transposase, ISXO2-like domain-containing protein [Strongyloides ratti]
MEHGILPKRRICPNGHQMKLYMGQRNQWNCNKRPCLKKIGLKHGTWFTDLKLDFVIAVRFIYCWSKELVSIKFCEEELGMSHDTTVKWCNYMREVCAASLERENSGKIGGEGRIVEVDESLFTRRKNHAGRVLPRIWILGGICRETGESFLKTVPDRGVQTLMKIIKDNVAEGSTIYTDSWKSYRTSELEAQGFTHFKVNHKYHFVDPESGAHTQTIERMWGSAKWRNKKQRGTSRNMLDSYLAEFMWRQRNKEENPFLQILRDIATFWPPEENT